MDNLISDTICAIATGQGGAISVIRVSGDRAIDAADAIFRPHRNTTRTAEQVPFLAKRPGYSLSHGEVRSGDELIDEVLVSVFRKPHSYTGEDSVEISCHASPYIEQRILTLLTDNGCRLAEPGEFTRRAFLAGKMDLTQAEAVADLIAAQTAAAHRTAITQMRGGISNELEKLRRNLLHLTSLMELELDFADHDDLEFANRNELNNLAADIEQTISRLLQSFSTGNALRNGIPVAIVGRTNVGKSTLLNVLVGDDRAIVSPIHGTTRDQVEDIVVMDGMAFRLIDTAGIRNTDDPVETLGIDRTFQAIDRAGIVIHVLDATTDSIDSDVDDTLCSSNHGKKKVITVINKCDICQPTILQTIDTILVSAKHGINIDRLRQQLVAAAKTELTTDGVVLTNARHYEALHNALNALQRVRNGLATAMPTDLVCEDLRLCLHHLAEITGGEITSQETLNNIFAHFCIGK